jgi:hypothetical protein
LHDHGGYNPAIYHSPPQIYTQGQGNPYFNPRSQYNTPTVYPQKRVKKFVPVNKAFTNKQISSKPQSRGYKNIDRTYPFYNRRNAVVKLKRGVDVGGKGGYYESKSLSSTRAEKLEQEEESEEDEEDPMGEVSVYCLGESLDLTGLRRYIAERQRLASSTEMKISASSIDRDVLHFTNSPLVLGNYSTLVNQGK